MRIIVRSDTAKVENSFETRPCTGCINYRAMNIFRNWQTARGWRITTTGKNCWRQDELITRNWWSMLNVIVSYEICMILCSYVIKTSPLSSLINPQILRRGYTSMNCIISSKNGICACNMAFANSRRICEWWWRWILILYIVVRYSWKYVTCTGRYTSISICRSKCLACWILGL